MLNTAVTFPELLPPHRLHPLKAESFSEYLLWMQDLWIQWGRYILLISQHLEPPKALNAFTWSLTLSPCLPPHQAAPFTCATAAEPSRRGASASALQTVRSLKVVCGCRATFRVSPCCCSLFLLFSLCDRTDPQHGANELGENECGGIMLCICSCAAWLFLPEGS